MDGIKVVFTPEPIIRKFGRMSQGDIAEIVGVSRPTVSAWLKGKPKTIELSVLEKFVGACSAQPGDFFDVIP